MERVWEEFRGMSGLGRLEAWVTETKRMLQMKGVVNKV